MTVLTPEEVAVRLGVTKREAHKIMRTAGGFYVAKNKFRVLERDLDSWVSEWMVLDNPNLVIHKYARLAIKSGDTSAVYFIQCNGDSGPIKIGISDEPQRRLEKLSRANPYPLRLIGIVSGGERLEFALHYRFRAQRLNGEWFSFSEDLMGHLNALIKAEEEL